MAKYQIQISYYYENNNKKLRKKNLLGDKLSTSGLVLCISINLGIQVCIPYVQIYTEVFFYSLFLKQDLIDINTIRPLSSIQYYNYDWNDYKQQNKWKIKWKLLNFETIFVDLGNVIIERFSCHVRLLFDRSSIKLLFFCNGRICSMLRFQNALA